jgi:aminopeptidase N
MTRSSLLLMLAVVCLVPAVRADERALDLPIGDPARKDHQVPLVVDGVTDSARREVVTPAELAARLDPVRILFVGESHTDMEFHRVQLRVIQELVVRGRQVLVGLEMYPASEQGWLDRWTSDKALSEESFLAESHWYRNWGYNWRYYRDIFLFARNNRVRMFGVNVPRALVQTVRKEGFDGLSAEQKALLPQRVDTGSEEHRRLFRAFFGPGDSLHGHMPEAMFEGMYRAQCTWDAAMGWNAVQALRQHGGENAIVVVLIGSGHVAYGLGAERQARLWFDGKTGSLVPVPVSDPDHPEPVTKLQASYADYVWGLPPTTDSLYPSVGITTPEQKSDGRYKVIMVADGSPAEDAGFRVGDEIVSIDGVAIDDKETANRLIAEKRWGDSVVYKVMREGEEATLTVFLRRHSPATSPAGTGSPASPTPPSSGAGR